MYVLILGMSCYLCFRTSAADACGADMPGPAVGVQRGELIGYLKESVRIQRSHVPKQILTDPNGPP